LAVLGRRSDLISRYLDDFPGGGLFVPGPSGAQPGQPVCVDIAFVQESLGIQSSGVVRWKRHRGTPNLPAGLGIEFTDDGSHFGPMLLEFASSAYAPDLTARNRRYHARMRVDCLSSNVHIRGVTRDISSTGIFAETKSLLPVGTLLFMRLRAPSHEIMDVPAEVVRQHQCGMGLRLIDSERGDQSAFRSLIADISSRAASAIAWNLG